MFAYLKLWKSWRSASHPYQSRQALICLDKCLQGFISSHQKSRLLFPFMSMYFTVICSKCMFQTWTLLSKFAIEFVPTAEVVVWFHNLTQSTFYQATIDILRDLVRYFEDTCIWRPMIARPWDRADFQHSQWKCYEAVVIDIPRTNNSVEKWQRGFSALLLANNHSNSLMASRKSKHWTRSSSSNTHPAEQTIGTAQWYSRTLWQALTTDHRIIT